MTRVGSQRYKKKNYIYIYIQILYTFMVFGYYRAIYILPPVFPYLLWLWCLCKKCTSKQKILHKQRLSTVLHICM